MSPGAETPIRSPQLLYDSPNALAGDYSRFRVGKRLLLTGHSHQAWPDCGFAGQQQAWLDAAEHVDDKWERAFAKAQRVREGWAALLDEVPEHIALGANTHELVVRLLSGLPLVQRPKVVTTDAEFHTLRRQLDRATEAGLVLERVPAEPVETLAERLAARVDSRTALVAVSWVLFRTGRIVPHLEALAPVCERHGAVLLIDAYHALNVIPASLPERGLTGAYVVGGGYKYCQLGEGNCFLRFPHGCRLRPLITGWYAEFGELAHGPDSAVRYGEGPARFAGATYDPTSHYRAVEVFEYFRRRRLTPELLRRVSQHQIRVLSEAFDALDLDPREIDRDRDTPLESIGGFLAFRCRHAEQVSHRLRERGVLTDWREDRLRIGPAPYLSDKQLRTAIAALGRIVEPRT